MDGKRIIGALCPFNELHVLNAIGGGNNAVALQQLPLFLNGRQVKFNPSIDAIHVATDQSIKAMFASDTESSSAYRMWDLPERQAASPPRKWQPSSTKFNGVTTNMEQFKTHDYTPTRAVKPPQVATRDSSDVTATTAVPPASSTLAVPPDGPEQHSLAPPEATE